MDRNLDAGKLKQVLSEIGPCRDNLIRALQKAQEEFGYVPRESIPAIARRLGVYPAEVSGIITFYSQFHTTPRGRNTVRVCRGTACHVRGARTVLGAVMRRTGIADGETSDDMRFSLETVACLGACALGPVMVVNRDYYGKLNPGRTDAILSNLP